jgi:hypothetical protein
MKELNWEEFENYLETYNGTLSRNTFIICADKVFYVALNENHAKSILLHWGNK